MPAAHKPQAGRAWFVTGTDTEIGKTFVTCALLHAARQRGLRAIGMKPVAAGTEDGPDGRCNEDVVQLRAASSPESAALAPALINPYCFDAPIAPHVAAAEAGVRIDAEVILSAFRSLQPHADCVLVEGVGGFRVPLGADYDSADLAADFGLPVILVVGLRLGCINHALLTAEAIERRGLALAGWVANQADPHMLKTEASIAALRDRIAAPLLGSLPRYTGRDFAAAAAKLTLPD